MLAACCAVLVSGVGFVLFVLDELAQLCDRTLEQLQEVEHLVTVAVVQSRCMNRLPATDRAH